MTMERVFMRRIAGGRGEINGAESCQFEVRHCRQGCCMPCIVPWDTGGGGQMVLPTRATSGGDGNVKAVVWTGLWMRSPVYNQQAITESVGVVMSGLGPWTPSVPCNILVGWLGWMRKHTAIPCGTLVRILSMGQPYQTVGRPHSRAHTYTHAHNAVSQLFDMDLLAQSEFLHAKHILQGA